MHAMTVSKKFYADIMGRIESALSFAPGSAAEAVRLVDTYLLGGEAASDDPCAMLAFNMIRPELDKAVIRSRRARERAQMRKKAKAVQAVCECVPTNGVSGIRISRQERRAIARRAEKERRRREKKRSGTKIAPDRERGKLTSFISSHCTGGRSGASGRCILRYSRR